MNKRSTLTRLARVATLTTLALTLALAPLTNATPAAAKGEFYFDFEETTKPWAAGGHGYEGTQKLGRKQGDSVCTESPFNYYAVIAGGTTDDSFRGTVPLPLGTWMETSFPAVEGPHLLNVTFYAKNESNCDGCSPMVYAGAEAPRNISQFDDVGETLKGYWQEYNYKAVVDLRSQAPAPPALHIALGWSGSNAAVAVDCLSVNFMPAP